MKSLTTVFATLTVLIFLDSCGSSPLAPARPATPTIDNVPKIAEGGSSQDTLNIKADDSDGAYMFERLSAEGGSSRDTIYLMKNTRAKFYKIRDFKIKRKP